MRHFVSVDMHQKARALIINNGEHSGNFVFDDDGDAVDIVYERSTIMDYCNGNCIMNFHTHPRDFISYYPEHPSPQDVAYLYSNLGVTTQSHCLFTPSFTYVFELGSRPMSLTTKWMINGMFSRLSARTDRATQEFRTAWLQYIRSLGIKVRILAPNTEFAIVTRKRGSYKYLMLALMLAVVLFYRKNNLMTK